MKIGRHWRVNGVSICAATHTEVRSYDGRARGRKVHLELVPNDKYDFPATRCGMLIVEFFSDDTIISCMLGRWCAQCFTPDEIKAADAQQKAKEDAHYRRYLNPRFDQQRQEVSHDNNG